MSWSTKTHLKRKGKAACAAQTYSQYLVASSPECLRCRAIANRERHSPARVRQLEAEIKELRLFGGQMANLCFNLSRQSGQIIEPGNAEVMAELFRAWDAVKRTPL